MLIKATWMRFCMPHWCGLTEYPYAGFGGSSNIQSDIAQMVEHRTVTPGVSGSIPDIL